MRFSHFSGKIEVRTLPASWRVRVICSLLGVPASDAIKIYIGVTFAESGNRVGEGEPNFRIYKTGVRLNREILKAIYSILFAKLI